MTRMRCLSPRCAEKLRERGLPWPYEWEARIDTVPVACPQCKSRNVTPIEEEEES